MKQKYDAWYDGLKYVKEARLLPTALYIIAKDENELIAVYACLEKDKLKWRNRKGIFEYLASKKNLLTDTTLCICEDDGDGCGGKVLCTTREFLIKNTKVNVVSVQEFLEMRKRSFNEMLEFGKRAMLLTEL